MNKDLHRDVTYESGYESGNYNTSCSLPFRLTYPCISTNKELMLGSQSLSCADEAMWMECMKDPAGEFGALGGGVSLG